MNQSPRRRSMRSGFTLLELILALSLSSLVMVAIGMAIHLQMRSLDQRREMVEEAQLARAVLNLVAKDIQSTLQFTKFDDSGFQGIQAAAGAALGGATGESSSGGSPSGGSPAGGTPSGGAPSGGAPSGGAPSGGAPSGGSPAGGAPSGGSPAGGTPSSGGAAGGTGGTEEEQEPNTENLAEAEGPSAQPGLYGNQSELQIDVARVPRADEYQAQVGGIGGQASDIPSGLKTVTYFMRPDNGDGTGGLIRRKLDRQVALYAAGAGGAGNNNEMTDEVVAPEVVALQFQYFDGTDLLTEWDSQLNEGLPVAVLITVQIRSKQTVQNANDPNSGILTFQKMVKIPVARPASTKEEEDTEGMNNAGL